MTREFYTEAELIALKQGCFVYDVESFANYFLVAFKDIATNKYVYFESIGDEPIQADWLQWMLDNFCLVGFNCDDFDLQLVSFAISRKATVQSLKELTRDIIERGERSQDVQKAYGFKLQKPNQIDLIEVAPLSGSLKTYAARLHCPHLQDLPFDPDKVLTLEEIAITRTYCFNDLDNTHLLLNELTPHIELRAALSAEFNKDVRSHSDAQLAQEIINGEIARVTGTAPKRQDFKKLVGTSFAYDPPSYIGFVSDAYNDIVREIVTSEIEIGSSGHVICPKTIEGRSFVIGGRKYAIGMGGLHSQEKTQAVISDEIAELIDRDVTGYYPNLILKNGFYPDHIGPAFLEALQNIVDRRYAAKKAKIMVTADSLKIASNGTFGKLSDPYSTLYSPKMMVQTTLTGQLSLLMQIENLTLNGFEVISANTDGIVTLVNPARYEEFCALWSAWEKHTKLETEETKYKALYSRDVNNYIAIKEDGKAKAKGVYTELGSALNSVLSKNPENIICADAVIAHITKGVPVEDSIKACKDFRRFLTVRKVTGGAQKDGRYLGKTIRWYYAKGVIGSVVYCKSGNKVPNSDGGKPAMTLPSLFPADIDYDRYVEIATGILEDIGYQKKRNSQLTLL